MKAGQKNKDNMMQQLNSFKSKSEALMKRWEMKCRSCPKQIKPKKEN
jgi:hypothetical protein